MLWAIDVGNTHTVFGLWDGSIWAHVWRLSTGILGTEDQIAASLSQLAELVGIELKAERVLVASVSPNVDRNLDRFAKKWLGVKAEFLIYPCGLKVLYEPATAVGADRLANAIAAKESYPCPIVIIDIGTATTFDVINAEGDYMGGVILAGPEILMDALTSKTAKLPSVPLRQPGSAIGTTTQAALQSGLFFGYSGSLRAILERISEELGGSPTVLLTGGDGELYQEALDLNAEFLPNLTLDGLRIWGM